MGRATSYVGCGAVSLAVLLLSLAPPSAMVYHAGEVLDGEVPVSVLYYGAFSKHQTDVIANFVASLSPGNQPQRHGSAPSVAQWWEPVDRYGRKAGRVRLAKQRLDEKCSLGKTLSKVQVERLAARLGVAPGGVAVVLTAADVDVEGHCSSECGTHGPSAPGGAAHVWVGNASSDRCQGRCAYGARHVPGRGHGETLAAPNGDIGVDGTLFNLAALLAGALTNPNERGYFPADPGAPVKLSAVCSDVYGRGAVRLDTATGAGYNVVGRDGTKYLVPALLDPDTNSCIIMT